MSDIICVLSKSSGKIFRAKKGEEDLKRGDLCIIESDLGGDLALVIDSLSEVCNHVRSEEGSVKILRKATDDDQRKFNWLRRKEKRAFAIFNILIRNDCRVADELPVLLYCRHCLTDQAKPFHLVGTPQFTGNTIPDGIFNAQEPGEKI